MHGIAVFYTRSLTRASAAKPKADNLAAAAGELLLKGMLRSD